MSAKAPATPSTVTIEVNGRPVNAVKGVSLAAALVGDRIWAFRRNPVSDEPRGPFCGMGICLECEVTVDGRPGVRACLTPVCPGMRVETAGAEEPA
ncbi:(2Fe-2S)-binding protein [Nonomuraea bangladeshensis]|uniref:(2Fe-2S)-binding protein n=1 Tax=Nonomuraea bangladeshensis TaxID=404385 RepID=UPI003C2E2416